MSMTEFLESRSITGYGEDPTGTEKKKCDLIKLKNHCISLNLLPILFIQDNFSL